jgi:hypothetical protein
VVYADATAFQANKLVCYRCTIGIICVTESKFNPLRVFSLRIWWHIYIVSKLIPTLNKSKRAIKLKDYETKNIHRYSVRQESTASLAKATVQCTADAFFVK